MLGALVAAAFGAAIMRLIDYFLGKGSYKEGYEDGYKKASDEYEAKFREQAKIFLTKTEELENLLSQQKKENQALKEKVKAILDEGSRLIGEYEGLEKRYNELNKKPSDETQEQFSTLKAAWDKLKIFRCSNNEAPREIRGLFAVWNFTKKTKSLIFPVFPLTAFHRLSVPKDALSLLPICSNSVQPQDFSRHRNRSRT